VCLLAVAEVDWVVVGNFVFGYWVAFVICLFRFVPVQLPLLVPFLYSSSF